LTNLLDVRDWWHHDRKTSRVRDSLRVIPVELELAVSSNVVGSVRAFNRNRNNGLHLGITLQSEKAFDVFHVFFDRDHKLSGPHSIHNSVVESQCDIRREPRDKLTLVFMGREIRLA
jgi:hypothetical protein